MGVISDANNTLRELNAPFPLSFPNFVFFKDVETFCDRPLLNIVIAEFRKLFSEGFYSKIGGLFALQESF